MEDFDLDRLIEWITSDNLHGEMSFGAPVGKEILEAFKTKKVVNKAADLRKIYAK